MTASEPTVVFDVGNVLIAWDPRNLYAKLFGADVERMEWFLANITTPAWNVEQDRGRSFADAVDSLVAHHPEWEAEIRAFDTRWQEMVPGPISESVTVLESLRAAGRPTYAITNFSREKWAESAVRFPFLAAFTGVVVSAHEGLLKPDPAIYRLLLDRYRLDAERCVFIDDSAANIAAAYDLGMRTIHFQRGLDLGRALVNVGVRL